MIAPRWLFQAALVLGATACLGQAKAPVDARRSGLDFMSPALQAMQRDDRLNPAMLWVAEGQALWSQPAGAAAKACSDCHRDAEMRGVATRFPAFDERLGRPLTLAGRILQCRVRHQQATAWPATGPDSDEALALQSWVALQSRGMAVAPPEDARLAPWRRRGEQLYGQRLGQLNLACSQCHDQHAGARLGGAVIPQAHPTGYPIYRLEWQGLGSLERRLRTCVVGVRAEPFATGADEWLALELYLAQRAAGMPLEAPAVRP
jgi:sulfur-oxidizing protein SoxA